MHEFPSGWDFPSFFGNQDQQGKIQEVLFYLSAWFSLVALCFGRGLEV